MEVLIVGFHPPVFFIGNHFHVFFLVGFHVLSSFGVFDPQPEHVRVH